MTQPWLHSTADILEGRFARDAKTLGGKGARLAWLADRGFDIPETWYLPARAFTSVVRSLPTGYELRSLLRAESARALYLRTSEARSALLEAPWPAALQQELEALYDQLRPRAPWGLCVRSSATSEDGHLTSMAGLAISHIGLCDREAFLRAVREVWASLYDPIALEYLRHHQVRDAAMAVVIQPTVAARASGVMLVPRSDEAHQGFVVNASFGLGVSVVNGSSTPDLLRLDDEGRVLEHLVAADKRHASVREGQLLDEAAPSGASLTEADFDKLASLGRRLRATSEAGWDVEFVFEAERLVLVQARPLTAQLLSLDPKAIYTNANLGEALPGVATPMTWSVASHFAEHGWRRVFEVLGCKVPKGTELVVNLYGRFYLNLSNLTRILTQVPWFDAVTLLELGGVTLPAGAELPVAKATERESWLKLPWLLKRLWNEERALLPRLESFEADLHKRVQAHRAMDLTILPDEGLGRRFREIERQLTRAGRLLLTCVSISFGLHFSLRALLGRDDDPEGRRASLLVSADQELESTGPALASLQLATLLRTDTAAANALRAGTALPDGPFARAFAEFLQRFGDRAVREGELATPRWREEPSTLLSIVQIAAEGDPEATSLALAERSKAARRALDREVALLPYAKRQLAQAVITRVRLATRQRERLRAALLLIMGMLREVVLDADRRLGRLMPELAGERARWEGQPGAEIPDAFFLTADELWDALDRARNNLLPFFRARRGEYVRNCRRTEPESTFVGAPRPVLAPPRSERLLGTGACRGVVSGVVRVLSDPAQLADFRPGEILVTHATDIGWTPVFPLATAIITELGGTLSHAAIVAREFGIPTVVGARGATLALKTGDRVQVDGETGLLLVLSRGKAA